MSIEGRKSKPRRLPSKKAADSEWDRIVADLCIEETDDIDRYVAACYALEREATRSRLPELYRLLKSKGEHEDHIREAAAEPIARLDGLRAMPELLEAKRLASRQGHDSDGLQTIITDLVWHKWRKASPLLLKMLRSRSAQQRFESAWLMGFAAQPSTAAPKLLVKALGDRSPRVRWMAASSLASFKPQAAVQKALIKALANSDNQVRASATRSLASFGPRPEVLEVLIRCLTDKHDEVRAMAASALGEVGDKSVVPLLRKASRDPASRVRAFAKDAIDKIIKAGSDTRPAAR